MNILAKFNVNSIAVIRFFLFFFLLKERCNIILDQKKCATNYYFSHNDDEYCFRQHVPGSAQNIWGFRKLCAARTTSIAFHFKRIYFHRRKGKRCNVLLTINMIHILRKFVWGLHGTHSWSQNYYKPLRVICYKNMYPYFFPNSQIYIYVIIFCI